MSRSYFVVRPGSNSLARDIDKVKAADDVYEGVGCRGDVVAMAQVGYAIHLGKLRAPLQMEVLNG